MSAPLNSPWAQMTLTGMVGTVEGEGTVLYDNKSAPPTEVQVNGLLLGTALPFQWINYQFDNIYASIEYLKAPDKEIITNSTTTRTFTVADKERHIRFTNASSSTYTINQGIASIGTTIQVWQGAAGTVTLTPGSGVTFNVKTSFAAKTSGINTSIFARKISQGSGVESWDVWGDLGT